MGAAAHFRCGWTPLLIRARLCWWARMGIVTLLRCGRRAFRFARRRCLYSNVTFAAFARNTGRVDEVGVVLLAPPRLQETRKGVGLTILSLHDYRLDVPRRLARPAVLVGGRLHDLR